MAGTGGWLAKHFYCPDRTRFASKKVEERNFEKAFPLHPFTGRVLDRCGQQTSRPAWSTIVE